MATPLPPQRRQTPPHNEDSPGGKTIVKIGCSFFVLGVILALVSVAIDKFGDGDAGGIRKPLGVAGVVLLLGGLLILVVIGLIIRAMSFRRARDGFAFAEPAKAEPEVLRRLEACRMPATADWAKFPSNVIATGRVRRGDVPITFSVNVPKLVTRDGRNKPMELPTCYLWMPMPTSLPRLIIRPDTRDGALIGRDVDIENEEFNRRFRADSNPPGTTFGAAKVRFEDFAPYAHAMLHPRAVQALLALPDISAVVIDGDLIGVLDRPYTSQARIDQIVNALMGFVALTPTHVVNRWGGQTGYRPRG